MQSLLIILPLKERDDFLSEIEEYYADRDDVTLLRYGTTRQGGERVGFIWIEFEDGPPDRPFLFQLKRMKLRFFVLDSVVEDGEEQEDEDDE
jgi:hypothetical protein